MSDFIDFAKTTNSDAAAQERLVVIPWLFVLATILDLRRQVKNTVFDLVDSGKLVRLDYDCLVTQHILLNGIQIHFDAGAIYIEQNWNNYYYSSKQFIHSIYSS